MTISLAMLASDFSFARADLPQSITIGAVTAGAIVEDPEKPGEDLMGAGISEQYALAASILKADFSTLPDAGVIATYLGVQYRITHWRDSADGLVRTLYMEDLAA